MQNRNLIVRLLKRSASSLVSLLDALLNRFRQPSITGLEYITGLNGVSGIYPSTIISVHSSKALAGHVRLGKNVYLGRRVELEAGKIDIDDDTSLQDGCAVRGDVKIGAHCIFGHNGLLISTSHRFRDRPEWLIRDQDTAIQADENHPSAAMVQIDDDCWFGWGATVMPGVHVGRGAVIGANSVVTRDVGPYEVHGGAPNRKIGQRLAFAPPESISALTDAHLPYFYRGFLLLQKDLACARADGVIFCRADAAVTLAGAPLTGVTLKGRRLDNSGELNLRFRLNGFDLGPRAISPGDFELELLLSDRVAEFVQTPVPGLARYTLLELQQVENAGQPSGSDRCRYGISAVTLLEAS
jgi:acetyltransferase-like isoleucine patch superfamily enzyme